MIFKERLEAMAKRYEELGEKIGLPEVVAKQDEWRKLTKEYSSLQPIVDKYGEYLKISENMAECKRMMSLPDKEMAELAEAEYYELRDRLDAAEEELKIMLLPKDPMDDKNVIVEIRPGAGGEESALFGYELMKMYKEVCRTPSLEDRGYRYQYDRAWRHKGSRLYDFGAGRLQQDEI